MRSRLIRFCAWMMWLCAALPAFSQARPSITGPSTLPGAQVGVPYSYTLQASGGQGALQWSATGLLPPGLTLAPSTGNISGIPTTAGNYGFRATVTDSLNRTDNKDFTIRVTSPRVRLRSRRRRFRRGRSGSPTRSPSPPRAGRRRTPGLLQRARCRRAWRSRQEAR
ncbi:MAG: putative Ig domain-containing protein [Acidobacteria bacterium]|nr:putative Ig domain-containing protein [Acidobacteriota bacterium]